MQNSLKQYTTFNVIRRRAGGRAGGGGNAVAVRPSTRPLAPGRPAGGRLRPPRPGVLYGGRKAPWGRPAPGILYARTSVFFFTNGAACCGSVAVCCMTTVLLMYALVLNLVLALDWGHREGVTAELSDPPTSIPTAAPTSCRDEGSTEMCRQHIDSCAEVGSWQQHVCRETCGLCGSSLEVPPSMPDATLLGGDALLKLVMYAYYIPTNAESAALSYANMNFFLRHAISASQDVDFVFLRYCL
jgi:hypothetical protein